jgi:hypothetical protein
LFVFALPLLRSAVELLWCALQFLQRATESPRNALPFVWCRVDFPRSTTQSSLDGAQLRRFELQFLRIAARFRPSGGAWGRNAPLFDRSIPAFGRQPRESRNRGFTRGGTVRRSMI